MLDRVLLLILLKLRREASTFAVKPSTFAGSVSRESTCDDDTIVRRVRLPRSIGRQDPGAGADYEPALSDDFGGPPASIAMKRRTREPPTAGRASKMKIQERL